MRKYSSSFSRRDVLAVQVLGLELSESAHHQPISDLVVVFRLGKSGEERRASLNSGETLSWDVYTGIAGSVEVFCEVLRKRVFGGHAVIGRCGPISVLELGVQEAPFSRPFQLVDKNQKRVGKILLEFSSLATEQERAAALKRSHTALINRLVELTKTRRFDTSSSSAPLSPREEFDEDGPPGYVCQFLDEKAGVSQVEQAEMAEETKSRFNWVLGPSQRQMEDAVQEIQRSFQRILSRGGVEGMMDTFYSLLGANPATRSLFANVDTARQKEKLATALKMVIENLQSKKFEVSEALKELGIRHVGYGVKLDHYNDVGIALIEAVKVGMKENKNKRIEN